jgi:hypothetical protein
MGISWKTMKKKWIFWDCWGGMSTSLGFTSRFKKNKVRPWNDS